MRDLIIGKQYYGSDNILLSQKNVDIIQPHKPLDWTVPLMVRKFTFMPIGQNCYVSINDGSPIVMLADIPWSIDYNDQPIEKFKILEDNVPYVYYFSR